MTDPIADFLTCIRNANRALLPQALSPYSRMKEELVKVLKDEGYVKGFETVGEGVRKTLVVSMKYSPKRERVIEGLAKVSKPGRRVYVSVDKIKPVRGGLGVAIISTPKGILSDVNAKKHNIGGEWICNVW